MSSRYDTPEDLAPWVGLILTCQYCGHSRFIDVSWLSSAEVRRALDRPARAARRVPRCSQCGARGWENISTEDDLSDRQGTYQCEDDYGPDGGSGCGFWREDDAAWEEHMEWLIAYERETEGPEAYGRGPLRFPT